MTLEKFYTGTSMPRNREIVRVFKDLDYVEQLGNGIPKIVKKYGRDAISIDSFVIQTTLRFDVDMVERVTDSSDTKTTKETTGKTTDKILTELKNNPAITMKALANVLEITADGVKWQLDKLRTQGIIRRTGTRKSGRWEIIAESRK